MKVFLIAVAAIALAGCSPSAATVVTETPAPVVVTATPDPASMLPQECQDALGVAGDMAQSSGDIAGMQEEVLTAVQDAIAAAKDFDISKLLTSTTELKTLSEDIDIDGLKTEIDDFVAASKSCTNMNG